MNTKKFSEAMSKLDSKYIDEAFNYKKSAGRPTWMKLGAAAACFAAAAAVGLCFLWISVDLAPSCQGDEMTSNRVIHYLSESGAIESKRIRIQNTPENVFGEWAELNNISDAKLIHCVYADHGSKSTQETPASHSAAGHSTLSLTVSGEFSKYTSNETGVLLIETLRRTFYDYNSFDELELMIENLTDSAISNGAAEPGMEADDGKSLVWEEMSEREIDGGACYAFELRYSEDEAINGEMAGRLLGIYAISKDSTKFYQYNMADDTWKQLRAAAVDESQAILARNYGTS